MESSVKRKIENYCAYQERCHSEVKRKLNSLGVFGKDVDEYLYYLIDGNFLNYCNPIPAELTTISILPQLAKTF